MFDDPLIRSIMTLAVILLAVGSAVWLLVLLLERLLLRRVVASPVHWNRARRPVVLAAAALAGYFALPGLDFSEAAVPMLRHGLSIVIIFSVGWLVIALTGISGEALHASYDMSAKDNRHARSVVTKFAVLRRVWLGLVIVCTAGAIFMTFPSIRQLGAGLLASAGVAGIIIGVAARPTVETLIASVQIAITEPIALDDVVIVEGEWGKIEEIRPTYVVVRIWDDRRLIVPLTYFINQTFQNWTRTKSELLGSVTVNVDYRTPVAEVRKEVEKIVTRQEKWDQRFWNLQVSDAGERTMTLRVLCTAADASIAWDLRCQIREELIDYLQREHPEALPQLRADLTGADDMQKAEG